MSANRNDGGFRNPAGPGLTRSLRINRQKPRAITQVMGNKHTIRNAFPLLGEARLYRAHVKITSN